VPAPNHAPCGSKAFRCSLPQTRAAPMRVLGVDPVDLLVAYRSPERTPGIPRRKRVPVHGHARVGSCGSRMAVYCPIKRATSRRTIEPRANAAWTRGTAHSWSTRFPSPAGCGFRVLAGFPQRAGERRRGPCSPHSVSNPAMDRGAFPRATCWRRWSADLPSARGVRALEAFRATPAEGGEVVRPRLVSPECGPHRSEGAR